MGRGALASRELLLLSCRERCVLMPSGPLVAAFGEIPDGQWSNRLLTKAAVPITLALTRPEDPAPGPWRPFRCGTGAGPRGNRFGGRDQRARTNGPVPEPSARSPAGPAGTPRAPPRSQGKEPLAPPPLSGPSSPESRAEPGIQSALCKCRSHFPAPSLLHPQFRSPLVLTRFFPFPPHSYS